MYRQPRPRPITYLAVETGLILAFSFATFVSGTYAGLFLLIPRLISQALAVSILAVWLASKLLPHWSRPAPRTWPATPLDVPLLAGLSAVGLSTLVSIEPGLSLENASLILCYALLFWFCFEQLQVQWLAELTFKCILIVAGIVCLFTLLEIGVWYTGWPDGPAWPALGLGLSPQLLPRVGSVGGPNNLGGYLAPLIPVALACGLAAGNWSRRLLPWGLAGTMAGLVWLTQSRGGLIGLLAGLGVLIAGGWQLLGWRWPRLRLTWRRSALAGLVFAVASSWIAYSRQWTGRDWAEGALSRLHPWLIALRIAADHPVLGVGPGAFGLAFLRYRDVNLMYSHAHSLYLQALASVGIVGVLAGAWLVVALIITAWRRWRSDPDRTSQWMRLGASAGLVVIGTHGLFDALAFEFPGIFLVAVILAAYAVRPIPTAATAPRGPRNRSRLTAVFVTCVAACSLGVTLWSDYGLIAFDQAVTASQQGDWLTTVKALQVASGREPTIDYYQLQLGLAFGQLPADDQAALEDAITAYRAGGIAEDPYSLNHANYAWLLWHAEEKPAAVEEMKRAVGLGQGGGVDDYINLGFMLEETGQLPEAQHAYAQAIALSPQLLGLSFWDAGQPVARDRDRVAESALRLLPPGPEEVTARRRAECSYCLHHWDDARAWLQVMLRLSPDDPTAWLELGRLEQDSGHPREALEALDHVFARSPFSSDALAVRVKAHLALNDLDAASEDMQVLRFLPATPQIWLLQGQLAEARGDFAAAERHYWAALQYASAPGPMPYAPMVWWRSALATDRVPFLLQPTRVGPIAESYLALGRLYARQGMTDAARQAYQEVLRIDPGRPEARRGLEGLQ